MSLKKFLQDYETVTTTDERGREKRSLVYRGDYFETNLDLEAHKRFKAITLALLIAIIGLHIGAGFIGNPGMYKFYVALPYVAAFFPLIYLAAGVLRLPREKRQYQRDEISLSFDRIRTTGITFMVFLLIGVLGEIIYLLFFSGDSEGMKEFSYLGIELLVSAASFIMVWLERKVKVETVSPTPQKTPAS